MEIGREVKVKRREKLKEGTWEKVKWSVKRVEDTLRKMRDLKERRQESTLILLLTLEVETQNALNVWGEDSSPSSVQIGRLS